MNLFELFSEPTRLKGYNKRLMIPDIAYEYLRRNNYKYKNDEFWQKTAPVKTAINTIAKDAHYSFNYARFVLYSRFIEGEAAIAKSAEYSYRYAAYMIDDRFELGEAQIATSAEYSYKYADDVLNTRFELGEEQIAKSDYYSYNYALHVLNGRFPAGEEVMATDDIIWEKYNELI